MDKIVNLCITMMLEYKVIDEQQKDIMVYGLDLLFSSMVSLASFILLGFCLNREIETIWLLITFIPLQSFGGGYHCQTHFRCWLLMMAGYLTAMFVLVKIPAVILWGGSVLGGYSFLKLAPVENPKAMFGEIFGNRMRKIVVCIYFAALLSAGIVLGAGTEWHTVILSGVVLSAISIIGAKVKNKILKERLI